MIDRLRTICDDFRRTMRRLLAWVGVSRLIALVLPVLAALVLADYLWRFGHLGRWAALVVFLATLAAVVWLDLVRPLRRRWADARVLAYLDRVAPPDRQDRLTSLAELAHERDEGSLPLRPDLIDRALEDLKAGLDRVEVRTAFRRRAVVRWTALAGVALIVCLGVAMFGQFGSAHPYTSVGLARLFAPWTPVRWPDSTYFTLIEPAGDTRVPEGEDLTVRAQVHGRMPDRVVLVYHTIGDNGRRAGADVAVTMFVSPDRVATYTFKGLSRSIRFHVRGGDGRSDAVTLGLLQRPFIREARVYYRFPPYTGVPPKISESPQLSGLEGTDARVAFTASAPLTSAWIEVAGRPGRIDLDPSPDGTQFQWRHQLTETTRYSVCLLDRFGNREKRPETFDIRVVRDQPPIARLIEPAGDLEVTARATFHVAYRVEDDFGLQEVRLIAARDDQPPQPVSEKITGPIRQIGKISAGSFEWGLTRLDLAGVRRLTCYLTARDVNPTRLGRAESARLQVTLLSKTDLQSRVLLASKAMLTEALLGSNNQRWAYLDARKWRGTDGVSEESRALARQTLEEHAAARRAADGLRRRFLAVLDEVTRNRMGDAFFERRLTQIGDLIREQAAVRQPALAAALERARPTSAAEDTPRGRADKLRKVFAEIEQDQKRAALEFARLLDRLRDWNDLQNALVKARRLNELQQALFDESFRIAPQWVGRELEDLNEDESKRLETLGQQQDTIFEAEQALEEELQTLALAARSQGRKRVFDPLKECFELLRLRAMSDKIFQCANSIKDNRVDATLEDQRYVIKVLTFVVAKFEEAGRDVKPPAEIDLATVIQDDREAVARRPAVAPESPGAETLVFNPESAVDVEDVDAYRVDSIEQAMVFLQSVLDDQVLLYMTYTNDKFAAKARSPRYRRLRLGMLGVRAGRAIDAGDKVLEYGAIHEYTEALPCLKAMQDDLKTIGRLSKAGHVGPAVQDLTREASAFVQAGRRALAARERGIAQTEDRRNAGGVDEFGQKYRVAGPDMEALRRTREDLAWAAVLQGDLNRKTRTSRALAMSASLTPRERADLAAKRQAAAVANQVRVRELAERALANTRDNISESDLKTRLAAETLATLDPADLAAAVADLKAPGGDGADSRDRLLADLDACLRNLDALLDERIRPEEHLAEEVVAAREQIEKVDLTADPEELARQIAAARQKALHDFDPDVIAGKVKAADFSPEVREQILRALARPPDPRYRTLLRAYFNSLVPPEDKKRGEN